MTAKTDMTDMIKLDGDFVVFGVVLSLVMILLALLWFAAHTSYEEYEAMDCKPAEGLYYRNRSGGVSQVLRCNND